MRKQRPRGPYNRETPGGVITRMLSGARQSYRRRIRAQIQPVRPCRQQSNGGSDLYPGRPRSRTRSAHARNNARRKGASIFIYLIFGLLIVIFVINFAPTNEQGERRRLHGRRQHGVVVDGVKVNNSAFKIAFQAQQEGKQRERMNVALDMARPSRDPRAGRRRARAARRSTTSVDEEIKKGWFFYAGQRARSACSTSTPTSPRRGATRGSELGAQPRRLRRDVPGRAGARLQATLMAELLAIGAACRARRRVRLPVREQHRHVRYRRVLAVGISRSDEADRRRRRALPRDARGEVKAKLQDRRAHVQGDEAAAQAAPDLHREGRANAGGADAGRSEGSGSAATPSPTEKKPRREDRHADRGSQGEARGRAHGDRGRTSRSSSTPSRQLTPTRRSKANGGDIGWRKVESAELGDKAVNDAVKALKPGEMTPVITTDARRVPRDGRGQARRRPRPTIR